MNKIQRTLLSLMTVSAISIGINETQAAPRTLLTHKGQIEPPQITHKNTTTTLEIFGAGGFPLDIPDGNPNGINIEIDTTGFFTGNITELAFDLGIQHNWAGDISATLTAPNGISQLVLFSRVGRTPDNNNGFPASLSGTYRFNDQANQDFWQVASNLGTIPATEYRTSTSGTNLSRFGGCTTRLNGAFSDLTPEQANGIWTLNIADNDTGFTGQVTSATLLADQDNSIQDIIFRSGFDREFVPLQLLPASNTLGDCKKAQFDFTGNGLSDFVTSWPSSIGDLSIQTVVNDGTTSPSQDSSFNTNLPFNDTVVTSGGDFDGDGITDLVFQVKRTSGPEGYDYLIRRSSRPNDKWVRDSTDLSFYDPQIGDYDGDGLDDLAWLFAPEDSPGLMSCIIVNSNNLQQRNFSVGTSTRENVRAAGGFDHNGDGIDDWLITTHIGTLIDGSLGNQVGMTYDGTNGSLIELSGIDIWSESARHLPGNFLNSSDHSRAGISMYIPSLNEYSFLVHDDSQFGFPILSTIVFGNIATDIPITGDYDGDGMDDYGVWSRSSRSFFIRPSGSNDPDNNIIMVSPFGAQDFDNPIGNSRVR